LLEEHETILFAETHRPQSRRTFYCIRDSRYKLVFDPDADQFEMYDLEADPSETTCIFSTHGTERQGWMERLREFHELASRADFSSPGPSEEQMRELEALDYGGG